MRKYIKTYCLLWIVVGIYVAYTLISTAVEHFGK